MLPVNRNSHGINSKPAIDKAVARGLKGLFKPPPMTLTEWAEEHYYLSPESSSIAGEWETIPYQKGIMNCISNDDIRKVTWLKSARVGYTKVIVAAMGYFAEHKKRSQVVYQPTNDDRDAFVKDEIEPMLRDVPVLKQIFPWFDKKHKNNTLQKKTFLGSLLHMLGGKSPRNFRRITVDVVYYDELAGFDHDIGGEGSATSLGDTRLTTSSFPKSIRGSTPKTKGTCQIEQSLEEADVVLRFYMPCPHCSKRQYLQWGGKGAEFGIIWDEGQPKTARYHCQHCKKSFGYELLGELLEEGRWQSEDGIWLDDDDGLFRDENNQVIDTPVHVGFCLWTGYSVFMSWSDMVYEYLEAVTASKRGELGKLKTFVNTRLGEVWEDDQGERLEPDVLYNRREHYPTRNGKICIPDEVVYLTIGGDTQDDRLEWEVVGHGANEESWSIDYQVLYGNLSQPEIWRVLGEMLQRPYLRADGTEMNIGKICWDSGGHFTDEVYALSKKLGLRWFIPSKGANQPGKPIADFPRKRSKKGVYLTMTGGDNAKELIYQRLNIMPKQGVSTPGACHWPLNDETHGEIYFQQMLAEKRTLKFSGGKRHYTYVCPNGKRNEVLDCRVGALAALRIAKQHFGIDLERLSREQKQARENGTTSSPTSGFSMADFGSLLGSS